MSHSEVTSRNATVVILRHATKPFTACDSAHDRIRMVIRLNEFIAQSLMVSLLVIVFDVFMHRVLK